MCSVIYKIWRSLENKRFVQFQTYGKNSSNFVFSQITFLYNSAPANHSVVFYGWFPLENWYAWHLLFVILTSHLFLGSWYMLISAYVCSYICTYAQTYLHLISFSWKQKKLLFVLKRAKSTQNSVFFSF